MSSHPEIPVFATDPALHQGQGSSHTTPSGDCTFRRHGSSYLPNMIPGIPTHSQRTHHFPPPYTHRHTHTHTENMSFGFSIGDIIAVSSIALKIYSTIHEAQSEQTALVHELEFFGHLVELIGQRLVCTDLPRSIARSTEQQLVQCQQLLLKLDAITKKYMAGYPGKQRFRMVKWGLWKRDQVMRLLGDLRSLIGLLDFLLCTYTTYVPLVYTLDWRRG